MKSTFLTKVFLVFGKIVNANAGKNFENSSKIAKAATTYVVNYEFCSSCLTEEEMEEKGTLEEVHTYAELKNDPRADLPSSFTICSGAMTTYGTNGQMFFNLLGNDRYKWLGSMMIYDDETSYNI